MKNQSDSLKCAILNQYPARAEVGSWGLLREEKLVQTNLPSMNDGPDDAVLSWSATGTLAFMYRYKVALAVG